MERLSDFILRVYPLEGLPFKRRVLVHFCFWVFMFVLFWYGIGFPDSTFTYRVLTATYFTILDSLFFYLMVYGFFSNKYSNTTNYVLAIVSVLVFYFVLCLVSYLRVKLIFENSWLSASNNRMYENLNAYYKGGFLYFFKPADIFINFYEIIYTSLPAFLIKISRNLILSISEKKQIEIEYLRSQINPHFLVNTLNNIYSLTITEDARSGDAILSLSSLLNYVLYETNESLISLEKEIKFLGDFIDLERIRNTKKLKVDFIVEGNLYGNIAPLILIAFVENAFKHSVADSTMMSNIRVHLKVIDGTLHFEVENSKPNQISERRKTTFGGIGLSNVKKRLNSLYRNSHTLQVKNERNLYSIYLTLTLK
jgi:sensor histidine kinase YesM